MAEGEGGWKNAPSNCDFQYENCVTCLRILVAPLCTYLFWGVGGETEEFCSPFTQFRRGNYSILLCFVHVHIYLFVYQPASNRGREQKNWKSPFQDFQYEIGVIRLCMLVRTFISFVNLPISSKRRKWSRA